MLTLSKAQGAPGYVISNEAGDEVLVQSDYDYPATATTFGFVLSALPLPTGNAGVSPSDWCPSDHDGTDGTIPCPSCGLPASFFIDAARGFLNDNLGTTTDYDPGYFIES